MVSVEAEAKSLLAEIAGPRGPFESLKAVLNRVALRTGLGERRIKGIYHGEVRALRATELAALLRAAREQRALEEAQHEYRTLDARLKAVEEALRLASAYMAGEEGDAVRQVGRPVD